MLINQVSSTPKQLAEANPRITQEVVRICSGHQIFFVFPYHRKVDISKVTNLLAGFLHGNDYNPWSDEKPSNFIIKVDSDEQQMFPYADLDMVLNSVISKGERIGTAVILNNPPDDSKNENNLDWNNMYYLKKATRLIKAKLLADSKSVEEKYNYNQLFQLLTEYSAKITTHEDLLHEGPPYSALRLGMLCSDLSTFNDLFLSYSRKSFEYNLPIAFLDKHDFFTIANRIISFPLRKINDRYILELNDDNYKRMIKYIRIDIKILVTPANFEYLADVYSEDKKVFQWLLDSRKEASKHPVIIITNPLMRKEIRTLVGKARPSKSSTKCDCDWCTTVAYWICMNCHELLKTDQSNRYRRCGCGDNHVDNIQFYCFSQSSNS